MDIHRATAMMTIFDWLRSKNSRLHLTLFLFLFFTSNIMLIYQRLIKGDFVIMFYTL